MTVLLDAERIATAEPDDIELVPGPWPLARWCGGWVLITALGMLAWSLVHNDGHLVYALDDAGIHLSLVRTLIDHGTWGVVPGQYVSATSSPAWTALLAAFGFVARPALDVAPFLLNLAGVLWAVWVIAREQTFLRPRHREWAAWIAAPVLVVFVAFLPSLTLIGMEHGIQVAITLEVFACVRQLARGDASRALVVRYLALCFVLGAFRIEGVFVALGTTVALVLLSSRALGLRHEEPKWKVAPALALGGGGVAMAALPFLVYGLVNRANGLPFLPTSIASKAARVTDERFLGIMRTPRAAIEIVASDPLLFVGALVVIGYAVSAWFRPPRRHFAIAAALTVTIVMQVFFGDVGFFERYQAYLIAAELLVVLLVLEEIVPTARRTAVLVALLACCIVAGGLKINATVNTVQATSNTYRQRYQLARFLATEYRGVPVASGELGYITYFHDGPFVDTLGIGSPEVLREFQRNGVNLPKEFTERVVRENGVKIIAGYPSTILESKPSGWVLVGAWTLDEPKVTAFENQIVFFAPDAASAAEAQAKLDQFAETLPSNVTYERGEEVIAKIFR